MKKFWASVMACLLAIPQPKQLWANVVAWWLSIPQPIRVWLHGLEVFAVTAVVSGTVALPTADFSTRAGVTKFVGSIVVVAGGVVRMYLAQSPVQKVIKELVASESVTASAAGVTATSSLTETTTQ